jgi:hypothetical protein
MLTLAAQAMVLRPPGDAMSLQVIGPGFGRTGTKSLKLALEALGLGPCHHMEEVLQHPEQTPHWQAVAAGGAAPWDAVFAGYRSQVDWPGAHVWRELAAAYPHAKVVLTVRPEEAWWASFSSTIGALQEAPERAAMPPHIDAMLEAGLEIIRKTFGGPVTDRNAGVAAYRKRIADVGAAISPDRLLVFDVAQGWEPLCRFLGKPIPEAPFPRTNAKDDFWKLIRGEPH